MKTLSLALNVLLIAALIFYACKGTSNISNSSANAVTTCMQNNCRDYSDVPMEGLISGAVLRSMTTEYGKDPGKKFVSANSTSMARSETRDATAVWFSIEKLKQYIWFIENRLCRSDCPAATQLGIKFYCMKYPANVGTPEAEPELRDVPPSYANLHSLAMVPGYVVGNELVDFDPRYIGAGCDLRLLRDQKAQQQGGTNYVDTARVALILKAASGGLGNNHGGLEPPNGDGIFGN